jgi:hypothetical protein
MLANSVDHLPRPHHRLRQRGGRGGHRRRKVSFNKVFNSKKTPCVCANRAGFSFFSEFQTKHQQGEQVGLSLPDKVSSTVLVWPHLRAVGRSGHIVVGDPVHRFVGGQ